MLRYTLYFMLNMNPLCFVEMIFMNNPIYFLNFSLWTKIVTQ